MFSISTYLPVLAARLSARLERRESIWGTSNDATAEQHMQYKRLLPADATKGDFCLTGKPVE